MQIPWVSVADLGRKKTTEFFDELEVLLREAGNDSPQAEGPPGDPTGPMEIDEDPGYWALDVRKLSGSWHETDRPTGETYSWPDRTVDEYKEFIRFEGDGDFTGTRLALGTKADGDVVGFALGAGGGSKRGITYFFRADNFKQTEELASMIRGGGSTGRAGFSPGEPTPLPYADFKIETLRERKAGKWNVQAVVVDASDFDAMLAHTALQARLRNLV